MGHYYVYKYRKSNNCNTAEEEYILNTEIEQLIDWFNKKDAVTDNGYMRLYILMQFLGMLCGLQLHYPSIITNDLIGEMFCETKALEELYVFLKDNNSVKKYIQNLMKCILYVKKAFLRCLNPHMRNKTNSEAIAICDHRLNINRMVLIRCLF